MMLLADSDLSHQDFHVLNALADSPGQRLQLSELAIRIGWERSRGRDALQQALPGHAALVRQMFFDGLDPSLLAPLRAALDQVHEQILAHGTLPRPSATRPAGPAPRPTNRAGDGPVHGSSGV